MPANRACRYGLMVLVLSATSASGQEWTRFRGPNGTGIAEAANIPVQWTAKDYRWRVELPGIGYSSPVIWGQKVFVTSALEEDATQIIRCLRTSDGGLLWERRFSSITHPKHRFNCYASATPPVDQDHLYVVWATPKQYNLAALEHEHGRTVWQRDLGPFEAEHGFGASPILVGDLLIVPNDQNGKSSVIALDRTTGKIQWEAARRSKIASYSTPFLFEPEGAPAQLILTSSSHGVSSLDPKTGKTLWELELLNNRIVGSGAVASGLIVATCGVGGAGTRTVVIRPGVPSKGVQAELAYDVPKGALPYVPVPVTCDSLLFLWYDRGAVTCLDAPTGKVHWRERIQGEFFGSPVRVGDRLYCISRDGDMVVLAAADKFKLLARFSLEERSNSTPAIADGVMYLRTVSHLMAIGGG